MFALRGIAVSLTFFVLTYCLLSALVAAVWRSLQPLRVTQQTLAGLLFAIRIFPLVVAVVFTLVFVVPSFQILEPRSIDEGLGKMPLALGICALLLIAVGCFRVITALIKTSRVVARWLEGAHPLNVNANVDSAAQTIGPPIAFRAGSKAPPLTLVGLRKPRVLISESAVLLLNPSELEIALKHELSHIQSLDNLKKLIFRFCPFPGMAALEIAWAQTAELAADDAAVSNLEDAVNLAAALVKVSRLVPVDPAPVCTVGFVTGAISARVVRLLAWDESGKLQPPIRWWYTIPPALTALAGIVLTYGSALVWTHKATEWLVH
jgi:Zn-dependent protease with chaperone function